MGYKESNAIHREKMNHYFVMFTVFFLLILTSPNFAKAQSHEGIDDFIKFIGKNYHLPEDLKYNCEWMYAIVRLRGDTHNKVISYEFLNNAPEHMKKNFNFLNGYQFPKNIAISKHPVVFYFSIDNKVFVSQNQGT